MGILVNQNQIGGGASNSSHNIGDIFYTTRTDNSLNGAVECNGSQYNFSDFDSNLQTLFDEGKLPYITIDEFDKSKKYSLQDIIDRNYNIDLCGFPHEEEEILAPMDLIQRYEEQRASLNAEIDRVLEQITSLLGGNAQ